MRKHIFTLMALAAALCACNKEQMIESETTRPVEPGTPLVFTATMEGAPESKATFDNTAKCASWEVGDLVNINGLQYEASEAGTTATFSACGGIKTKEIRPTYVSSTDTGSYENQPAQNLVDDAGTSTRWIAHKNQRYEGVWNIVVSTDTPTLLKTIKLWNAQNSGSYVGRRWKEIEVSGRMTNQDAWRRIEYFEDLNLAINNYELAGEIAINSSTPYVFYRINILDNCGNDYMQMTDMKFVVEPAAPYHAYFPANLLNGEDSVLPSSITETWAEGRFNMPMYAQSNTPELEFKNLCGVLKITVKSADIASVKSIRVSSSNKATSGAFTVTKNTAVLTSPETIANNVTVTYTNAVNTTADGTVFYVAIPAQTYQNLKIEFSSDGVNYTKSMTTKKNTDITVERNKIYPITFTPRPTTGTAKATINGQQVDVPWVQLWEDGPKFAKYNLGVTNTSETDYGGLYLTSYDIAANTWGSAWRMPTLAEYDLLISKCTSQWETKGTVKGRTFKGIGNCSNNYIFLPANGSKNGLGTHNKRNEEGRYVTLDKFGNTFGTLFFATQTVKTIHDGTVTSKSIRPVLFEVEEE